jgi:hypothetical protein
MTFDVLRRLAATALACAAVGGLAACGSSDSSTSSSSSTSGSTASAQAAGGGKLDAEDSKALDDARTAIADQCKDQAATLGAVATIESLYDIDPKATDEQGTSVEKAVADGAAQLRACGSKAQAKRLAKLSG